MGILNSKVQSPSYDEARTTLTHLNNLLKTNIAALSFTLQLICTSLHYNQHNAPSSTVTGILKVEGQIYSLLLTMGEVRRMFQLMKHVKADCSSTPTGEQCCICYAKVVSMVLPCSHAYCDACTIKFIIDMEEKKCPQCRNLLIGSKESVTKMIYSVIQDEEEISLGVREEMVRIMMENNERVMKEVKSILQKKKNR